MSRILYCRTSGAGQSVESQRAALGDGFDREFIDEGVSGAVLAAERPAFRELLAYAREGDELFVYAVDRLGRDALDVQATVRKLIDKGVIVDVRGLGKIGRGAGELILAVLAQVADMERMRIIDRCESGRNLARDSLRATGLTHRGKPSLGRSKTMDPAVVTQWRRDNRASISETAKQFNLSTPTVKRYCRSVPAT